MIAAITAHFLIGVGGMVCATCGKKICRHRSHIIAATAIFILAEAIISVVVVDHLLA